jgi:hypothetical protein
LLTDFSFYSLAIEVITRKKPYEELTDANVIRGVTSGNLKPKIPQETPAILANLMQKCWESPEERPTAAHIAKELTVYYESICS